MSEAISGTLLPAFRCTHAGCLLLSISMLGGCVLYPAYKTLQPAAQITVLDEANVPIEGVQVELITNFNPHGVPTREAKTTDRSGVAPFDLRREWQTESLMIHGVRYYHWNWCVRKPGFMTYVTGGRSGNEFAERATIVLRRGTLTECPYLF